MDKTLFHIVGVRPGARAERQFLLAIQASNARSVLQAFELGGAPDASGTCVIRGPSEKLALAIRDTLNQTSERLCAPDDRPSMLSIANVHTLLEGFRHLHLYAAPTLSVP